jgi:prevent-host-death family protein
MSITPKRPLTKTLADLPRTSASDLKRIGWRGVMLTIRDQGKVVVTNHGKPEAVIIAAEEYDAIMQIVREAESKAELALTALRQSFDDRLSALQGADAGTRLRSISRKRAKLGGKVRAGTQ